ncbi:MAG: Formate hydrogenlyase subunit 5 [Pseudomonadales bacterium]|nr:Formate hydrogenlyase subunit 5 [Pseudomonadales bacterium]
MNATLAVEHAPVTREQWLPRIEALHAAGARLLTLWASDERDHGEGDLLRAAFLQPGGVVIVELALPDGAAPYPRIDELFPAAARLQRALRDLSGVQAEGGDRRPWIRHGAWSDGDAPLRRDFRGGTPDPTPYGFVRVRGDGVHEIAVGPVHAGTIEPGHFRFSVVGEKVLRLEQRLGYVHKGIERRFTELAPAAARRLAARVSGDSAVAFAWAFCLAEEHIRGVSVPPRATFLRALLLERERIANHLGDLGALGNDAGFGVGLAQFMRLKEDLLRVNAQVFGARYPMDAVVTGGVAIELTPAGAALLQQQFSVLAGETERLRAIYDDHAGMQDRFLGCGKVPGELARRLGVTGLVARASGIARDLRVDLPLPPYDALAVRCASAAGGDVAARVAVRFDELAESLRLGGELLRRLPPGEVCAPAQAPAPGGFGVGLVEGWRGPVFVALETATDGSIRRCHPHDPSWHNWPALEHAIIGDIVPDFPLINKSFNLSYSGVDL